MLKGICPFFVLIVHYLFFRILQINSEKSQKNQTNPNFSQSFLGLFDKWACSLLFFEEINNESNDKKNLT